LSFDDRLDEGVETVELSGSQLAIPGSKSSRKLSENYV